MMPVSGEYHPVKWLDDHGWTKYKLRSEIDGSVCLMGAVRCIDDTFVNRHTDIEELVLVRDTLLEITGYQPQHKYAVTLAEVNDHPDTTLQNVRDALVKVFGDYA